MAVYSGARLAMPRLRQRKEMTDERLQQLLERARKMNADTECHPSDEPAVTWGDVLALTQEITSTPRAASSSLLKSASHCSTQAS
jgi:hypothetical protein